MHLTSASWPSGSIASYSSMLSHIPNRVWWRPCSSCCCNDYLFRAAGRRRKEEGGREVERNHDERKRRKGEFSEVEGEMKKERGGGGRGREWDNGGSLGERRKGREKINKSEGGQTNSQTHKERGGEKIKGEADIHKEINSSMPCTGWLVSGQKPLTQ